MSEQKIGEATQSPVERPPRPTLRELAASYPPHFIDWWERKSDEEKREQVQDSVDHHGGDFSPDSLLLIWLLEQVGVKVP